MNFVIEFHKGTPNPNKGTPNPNLPQIQMVEQVDLKKRCRNWVFTLNNYTSEDIQNCLDVPCRYIMFGEEIAPTTKTPHLQGTIVYHEAKSRSQVSSHMRSKAYLAPCVALEASIAYSSKEGKVHERGDRPKSQSERGRKGGEAEQERWKQLKIEAETTGTVSDPKVAFKDCRTIDYIRAKALRSRVLEDSTAQHLWYYGPSGTGKSRKARSENPTAYLKMCNKWWDGYAEEEVALVEDFDVRHEAVVHYMKIWADRYPFMAENKGTVMKIRPKLIIVTSNWHPRDIWTEENDLGPILRRFKCIHFPDTSELFPVVQQDQESFVESQFATN